MPIKSIQINNFKSISNLELNINKNQKVICFVGENGSSKTSLLSLIVDTIITHQSISFPDYDPNNGKRFRSVSQQEIGEATDRYQYNLEYISNDEHIINYKRIVFNKKKTTENSEIFQNSDDIFILDNNFHGEKNTPELNKSNNYFRENIFLFRPSYRYEADALEINSTDENFNFQVNTKKEDVDYPFPFKISHSGYNIENLIIELFLDMHIGYQDSGSAFTLIPKILNKITNKDYGNFQISRHPYRRLWSSTKGIITSLSQGELDLLVTITSIIARQLHIYNENSFIKNKYNNFQDIPGLVIIDEVDLHLHPKAQETYIKTLTSIFKNIQFLVTTHSPFVIRGLPEESIVIQLPTGLTIKESFSMMDIDSITNLIFNYDGRFSLDVESDLKLFKNMISQTNEQDDNLQLLANIYKKYKSSPSIINELDTYLSIFSSPDFTQKIIGD